MYRQIIGYIPSNIIPAFVSILMIYAYTRLLSPESLGIYTYLFSAVLILQTSLFHGLCMAVIRFYPAADAAGRLSGFLRNTYGIFFAACACIILLAAGAGVWLPVPAAYRAAAWLALPVLLFRSLVQVNQAVNRSANNMRRFNATECAHAVLGFALGLAAVKLYARDAASIILGLLIAGVCCSLFDLRHLTALRRRTSTPLDRAELMRLLNYAWPMVAVTVTMMIMQNADRFVLGSVAGTEALGIFAVAYNVVERPTTIICNAISTATFPLVVRVLEHESKAAARLQAGRNGIALLVVALPASVGLALTADHIAAVLVGPAFRDGVAMLIPVMSFTALARGIRSHFVDHAFHLSRKPLMMLWTYVPATIVDVALNLYLVPRYGMLGAAWAAFACQWGTVISGWCIGSSLFPVWLPLGQMLRSVAAVVPMTVALPLMHTPHTWPGLLDAVALGGALYVASAILLDAGELRSVGGAVLRRRRLRRVGTVG